MASFLIRDYHHRDESVTMRQLVLLVFVGPLKVKSLLRVPSNTIPEGGKNMSEPQSSAVKLYVGNLPWSVGNDQLAQMFAQAGTVVSATVILDRFSGRSKGFGFVEMATQEEADAAIAQFNEQELEGRALVVNVARPMVPREQRSFGGNDHGGSRGGFGGGRGGDRGGRGGDRGGRGGFGGGSRYNRD